MSKRYFSKYEWRWALIFSLLSLFWSITEYELEWHSAKIQHHLYFTYLFIIPAAICYFLFFYDKRAHRFKKRFKFKHAFQSGLGLTVLICLLQTPLQFLIHYLITPDYLDNMRHYIENNDSFWSNFPYLFTIQNAMWFFPLIYFIMGLVITLIYATIFRKSLHAYSRGYRKRR